MAEPGSPLRLFFALWPDRAARETLSGIAQDLMRVHGGRRVRSDMMHMTLAFIGAVPASQVALLGEIGAGLRLDTQRVVLDRFGGLSRRGLVWAAPSEPPHALMSYAEALAQALGDAGFEVETRVFRPHVTLLRHARSLPVAVAPPEPVVMYARRRALIASENGPNGARYRELMHWEG